MFCHTGLVKLENDKHSNLLQKSVIYVQKSFITLGPGVNVVALIFFVILKQAILLHFGSI